MSWDQVLNCLPLTENAFLFLADSKVFLSDSNFAILLEKHIDNYDYTTGIHPELY